MTGRYWDRLVPHLDGPAVAVDLPGRGSVPGDPESITVDDCVAAVLEQVGDPGDDVTVVAHSSGGLVAPGVARGLGPATRRIVLNAASVPPEGGRGLDSMKESHRARIEAAPSRRTPGAPDDPEQLRDAYGETLDDETIAFVLDRMTVDTMNVYFQPVSWAGLDDVEIVYVKNLRDRPVPPALQDEMASRLPNVKVVELDAGHVAAITQPERLAAIVTGGA